MKNLVIGLLFCASSIIFFIQSLFYKFGSLTNFGPGLFPIGISVILFFVGLILLFDYFYKIKWI
jgi:hypothetical protein